MGVQDPSQNCLYLGRGAFGFEFCGLHEALAGNWLIGVACVRAAGDKYSKGYYVGLLDLSGRGVEEHSNEVINKTVGSSRKCSRDANRQRLCLAKRYIRRIGLGFGSRRVVGAV